MLCRARNSASARPTKSGSDVADQRAPGSYCPGVGPPALAAALVKIAADPKIFRQRRQQIASPSSGMTVERPKIVTFSFAVRFSQQARGALARKNLTKRAAVWAPQSSNRFIQQDYVFLT